MCELNLSCGCQPGRVLCDAAMYLMDQVYRASLLRATNGNYAAYQEAKNRLAEHFKENQPKEAANA